MGAGPGLEARAVRAPDMVDDRAIGAQLLGDALGAFAGLVGRIVEKLDAQLVLRPVEQRDAAQRLLGDERLVEHRDLQQHMRQVGVRDRRGLRVAGAARKVVEEAADDDEIANSDGHEDRGAGIGDGVDEERSKDRAPKPYPSFLAATAALSEVWGLWDAATRA